MNTNTVEGLIILSDSKPITESEIIEKYVTLRRNSLEHILDLKFNLEVEKSVGDKVMTDNSKLSKSFKEKESEYEYIKEKYEKLLRSNNIINLNISKYVKENLNLQEELKSKDIEIKNLKRKAEEDTLSFKRTSTQFHERQEYLVSENSRLKEIVTRYYEIDKSSNGKKRKISSQDVIEVLHEDDITKILNSASSADGSFA
tara:strand:- start:6379 stop:6981 length:603 start_codon:yes stop_codon:yes gene_type:complete